MRVLRSAAAFFFLLQFVSYCLFRAPNFARRAGIRVAKMKVLAGAIASALLTGVTASPIAARDTPTVDLGYSVYSGSYDAASNINAFKG